MSIYPSASGSVKSPATITAPKVTQTRGRPGRRPGSGHRQRAMVVSELLDEIKTLATLEHEQRRQFKVWRGEIYQRARQHNLTATELLAFAVLTDQPVRNTGNGRTNGGHGHGC